MKLLIIDELSMVSSDLWTDIDSRLGEIFMLIHEKALDGLSVMAVVDLLQLPPVRKKILKYLLGLQLWNLYKCAKLRLKL